MRDAGLVTPLEQRQTYTSTTMMPSFMQRMYVRWNYGFNYRPNLCHRFRIRKNR